MNAGTKDWAQDELTSALRTGDVGTGLESEQQATILRARIDTRKWFAAFPMSSAVREPERSDEWTGDWGRIH